MIKLKYGDLVTYDREDVGKVLEVKDDMCLVLFYDTETEEWIPTEDLEYAMMGCRYDQFFIELDDETENLLYTIMPLKYCMEGRENEEWDDQDMHEICNDIKNGNIEKYISLANKCIKEHYDFEVLALDVLERLEDYKNA